MFLLLQLANRASIQKQDMGLAIIERENLKMVYTDTFIQFLTHSLYIPRLPCESTSFLLFGYCMSI